MHQFLIRLGCENIYMHQRESYMHPPAIRSINQDVYMLPVHPLMHQDDSHVHHNLILFA